MIKDYFHQADRGQHLNIAHTDEIMGDLTASPDLFHYQVGQVPDILLNVRYPKGIDAATITKNIQQTLAEYQVEITASAHSMTPHYVAPDDPLVATLLSVFEARTGQSGHQAVVGGGTYGRLLKRGVAFGALFDETKNVMHQANEYTLKADFLKAAAIYAQAIFELAK
ncbi:dipeptidase PepV [Loigolactobacillus coryniformis subsp. torquens DSM 20004 = KCTC 3535]|nr:dipeptidase PepV [Loigolactobacillus coryniformis subsp. torquens DSM 20004 = KCTC 3535]